MDAVAGFLAFECVHSFGSLDNSNFPIFDWLFILVPGLMALIFGACALVILFCAFGMKGRKRHLKFYDTHLIADPEWPIGAAGGTFEKSQFERVDMSRTGHSNGDPRYSVKLIGTGRALPICRFRNEEEAKLVTDWVRAWLD